jgi:hypothetical protein
MKIRRLFLVSFLIMAVSMLTGWKRHHKKHKIKMPVEKPKKIQRKVELEADTIVFPYAEAEKMQSVDGAAITINVKP